MMERDERRAYWQQLSDAWRRSDKSQTAYSLKVEDAIEIAASIKVLLPTMAASDLAALIDALRSALG